MADPRLVFFNLDHRAESLGQQQRNLAERKARALLIQHLDSFQRRMFEKHGYFFVKTTSGATYRLGFGLVEKKVGPRMWQRYCIQTVGFLPIADEILAKKLHLEKNEGEFLKTAIKKGVVYHP